MELKSAIEKIVSELSPLEIQKPLTFLNKVRGYVNSTEEEQLQFEQIELLYSLANIMQSLIDNLKDEEKLIKEIESLISKFEKKGILLK